MTEKFAQSEKVMELGRRLVEELRLVESNDTLGRWMAHYIADLMVKAEDATAADKEKFQRETFDAILNLWRHRSGLPSGVRPFEKLEPVVRAVESLDPENDTPRYFRMARPPREDEVGTSEQEKWLDLAEGLDYTAKILIGYCLIEAAGAALDKSKEWVKLAEAIDDDGASEFVIRIMSKASDLHRAPDPDSEQRKLLSERIRRLRSFTRSAASVADSLDQRLHAATPGGERDTLEEIGLVDPPTSEDPFEAE